jgi:hypothetical protein
MSLNMGEVMARRAPVTGDVRSGNVPTARATEPASATAAAGLNASEASAAVSRDLQLQIRELTQSNLDLRDRLSQQTEQLKELKDEIGRLRRELDRAKTKTPPTKKPASP